MTLRLAVEHELKVRDLACVTGWPGCWVHAWAARCCAVLGMWCCLRQCSPADLQRLHSRATVWCCRCHLLSGFTLPHWSAASASSAASARSAGFASAGACQPAQGRAQAPCTVHAGRPGSAGGAAGSSHAGLHGHPSRADSECHPAAQHDMRRSAALAMALRGLRSSPTCCMTSAAALRLTHLLCP